MCNLGAELAIEADNASKAAATRMLVLALRITVFINGLITDSDTAGLDTGTSVRYPQD